MKITEITINPQMVPTEDPLRFRVGTLIVEGGHRVEKIVFHPCSGLFNKGREVGIGSYAIFFEGISERRLIMSNVVVSVEVVTEKKKEAENIPELPE